MTLAVYRKSLCLTEVFSTVPTRKLALAVKFLAFIQALPRNLDWGTYYPV